MMESVDKLREWASSGKLYSDTERFVLHFADEIEREIAERYMELPVDADGVPIRVGDHMEMEYATSEVVGVGTDFFITGERIEECLLLRNGWNFARNSHHVKPRTLEDVLRDYYFTAKEQCDGNYGDLHGELIPRYAEEIRELLGGDAQ